MSNIDNDAVKFAVDAVIATNDGKTFVSKVHTDSVRAALIKLLEAFDVRGLENKITADELAMLYASTRNSYSQGKGVAERLAKKHGRNPLLDDVFSPPKQAPTPLEFPKDSKPAPVPMVDLDKALDPLWRALDGIRNDNAALAQLPATIDDKMVRVASELELRTSRYIEDAVAEAVRNQTPTRVEIVTPDAPPVQLGLTHYQVPRLIKMLAAGLNVYAHGPAGSGKTTGAQQAADAFKLPFYFAAKVESEYMLLGFKDARGETVRTQFREAYEHGGVFLFDELDGSSAGAVVALNAALANGVCPFPDGVIKRHPDFKCIGGGNTGLTGATRQYVGRNQLDAASVDRFAFLDWQYDDQLERALATDQQWCRYVQAVRKAIKDRNLPHLVTPRATYDGCKLLAAGDDVDSVADAVVWKALDRATVAQLQAVVGDISDYFDISLVA